MIERSSPPVRARCSRRVRLLPLALLGLGWSTGVASAHAPFIQPLNFAPSRDYVTVLGGMHEETVFVPDFALRPGDFWVVGPDGVRTKLEGQATLKGVSAVDVPLPAPGTYRITTGDRVGREATMAQVDGKWRPVRGPGGPGVGGARREGAPAGGDMRRPAGEGPPPLDPSAVPAGAPTMKTTGVLKAEAYVSRGAPSSGALKATGQGFELEPITHPDEVYLDKGFSFRLLNDGAPTAGVPVLVRRGGEQYAETKTQMTVTTDAQGRATARFTQPGLYILEARWPGEPAPGAAPAARSTALSLALEVTP